MAYIFLNRFFYPDHSATSQMLSSLAFGLAERGHRVSIITSRASYDGRLALPAQENIRGVEVFRVRTTRFGRHVLALRLLDYLSFYVLAALKLLQLAQHGDVVIAKTDPPMLSILTLPAARFRGARHVNWLQDVFPEVASELGLVNGRLLRLAFALLRRSRDRSLRNSDLNIVLGDRMAERIKQSGVEQSRLQIIPNWANGVEIRPIPHRWNRLRREWELADAFIVAYSGNLGRAHEIRTFLAAIGRTEEAHAKASADIPEIRWLFIGGGASMDLLKAEVARRAFRTVEFRPYQPQERLAESLSAADLHLISLKPSLEGLIVPSKYYGIAAAGRAAVFVGRRDGEIARILEESGTGFAVEEGDGSGLASAILTLAANKALAASQGERARRLFEERYDFPIALHSWETALARVTAEGAQRPAGQGSVNPTPSANPLRIEAPAAASQTK